MATNNAETSKTLTLSLDELVGQPDYVEIDGHRYELADSQRFSLRDSARLRRLIGRLQELEKIEEPLEADEQEHVSKSRELTRMALPTLPSHVGERLDQAQIASVVTAFFVWAASKSRLPRVLEEGSVSRSISAGSWRTSSNASVETRASGSSST